MRNRVLASIFMNVSVSPVVGSLALLFGSQVITAVLGLGLGKATAMYIAPPELGQYNLVLSGLNLAHVILIVPILQAFKAGQAQAGVRAAFAYYGRLARYVYGGSLVALLALGYVHNQVGLALLIGLAGVGQGVYAGGLDYLNLSGQQRLYASLQIGYAVLNLLVFGLLAVHFSCTTSAGLWVCLAFTNSILGGVAFVAASRAAKAQVRSPHAAPPNWRNFRAYAAPLVPMAFWGWLLNYGDRYLVGWYLTQADVGQYSVGYSLGAKLVILVSPFVAHSSRRLYALRAANVPIEATWSEQRGYLLAYAGLATMLCLSYYLLGDLIGSWLLAPPYRQAFQIGPLVAIGYLFLTLIHLLEVQWYAYGRTKLILWTTIIGTLANLLLNMLFIPGFGLMGAAYACVGGFMVQLASACYFYRRSLAGYST